MKRNFKVCIGVPDRNAYAALLADGETPFDCWFTPGVVRHYDSNGHFIGTGEMQCPDDAMDSAEWLKENMWIPSNCECLENILGDVALIYYCDDEIADEDCYGWQIFHDGIPQGMHDCHDGEIAYRKLSKMGFRY